MLEEILVIEVILQGQHQQLGLIEQLNLCNMPFWPLKNEQDRLNEAFDKVLEDLKPATVDFSDMWVIVSSPSWFVVAQIGVVVIAVKAYQAFELVGLLVRRGCDIIELIEIECGWDGRKEFEMLIFSFVMTPFLLMIQVPC